MITPTDFERAVGYVKRADCRSFATLDATAKMLGVMRMKSLLSSRDRRAKSKFSRGRGFKQILENIITRES